MGVLGQYLATLTTAQADRVLTMTMLPGSYHSFFAPETGKVYGPCLVGCANNCDPLAIGTDRRARGYQPVGPIVAVDGVEWTVVEFVYDRACQDFGVGRVNAAIRLRLLRLRAGPVPAEATEALVTV